jgi:methionyl-tRNA formyltransferase
MNFIYFGSSQFAKVVLEQIAHRGLTPELVVTTPDRRRGRHLKLQANAVKQFCRQHSLPVIAPASLKAADVVDEIKSFKPDFLLVVSYGKIIPKSLLDIPAKMPLAAHPSLLPSYRGASPIQAALLNGDSYTGVTVFKMNQFLDSGPIVINAKLAINNKDNLITLSEKLAGLSAELSLQAMERVNRDDCQLQPQDDSRASYVGKIKKTQGRIDWSASALDIYNMLRAFSGWPRVFTYYNQMHLTITAVDYLLDDSPEQPGTVIKVGKKEIQVATGKGILVIKRLQPAGKKEMDVTAFLCGHKIKQGDCFN